MGYGIDLGDDVNLFPLPLSNPKNNLETPQLVPITSKLPTPLSSQAALSTTHI